MMVIKYAMAMALLGMAAGCVVVAPEPVQDNQVAVCHKGKKTLYVGEPAVDAHLKHGDYVGACR
jgi:hypothetical protein